MAIYEVPKAIAIYCTDNGDLYECPLYSHQDIEAVRNQEHPDIGEDYKAIIVFPNMTTEDYT